MPSKPSIRNETACFCIRYLWAFFAMHTHEHPCTPMANQKPGNGDYMLKHVRIRKIGKWLVLITAYLYIPLLVTFMLKGNRSGSLDIPVGKSVITGPKVNIVYNMNFEDGVNILTEYETDKLRTESSNNIIYDDDVFS